MKINNKGLSIVELVVSFAMVAVLLVIITSMVVNVQNSANNEEIKTQLVEFKNMVTKAIYEDILYSDTNVNRLAYCNGETAGTCVDFYNSDGDSFRLILEKERRTGYQGENQYVVYLKYRGIRYMLPDSDINQYEVDEHGNIDTEKTIVDIDNFVVNQDDNNHIYSLVIPFSHKGIKYNDEIRIVITNLNVKEKKYTEISYLSTNGDSYIDTGLLYRGNYSFKIKASQVEGSEMKAWFGARNYNGIDSEERSFSMWSYNSNWRTTDFNSSNVTVSTFSNDTKYRIKFIKNKLYIGTGDENADDSNYTLVYTFTSSTDTTPVTLTLGAVNNGLANGIYNVANQVDYRMAYLRIYSCQIWDENDNLIRNYIPVKNNEGVECLYDKITKSFYYLKKRT